MGLLFKNPRFGNTFTLLTGIDIKRTVDGSLIADSHKRSIESFTMSWHAMSVVERDAFIGFCQATAGEEVTMTDHEGFEWQGFITDQAAVATSDGPGCKYSVVMNFEGKIISGIPPIPVESP